MPDVYEPFKGTMYKIKRKHIPIIDFSKQIDRVNYKEALKRYKAASQSIDNLNKPYNVLNTIGKKVRGLIPMKIQLPRNQLREIPCLPEYHVDYSYVFPKIKLTVDYNKELKFIKEKYKRRVPLTQPVLYSKAQNKLSSINFT